jgi:multisubunit Na+/H+ antiporter MnhB subunit
LRSLIVKYIAELILLVTTTFAVYLLLRGHDEPGGGFAAGIAATLGILLQAVATGFRETRRRLEGLLRPAWGLGMVLAVGAAVAHMATGAPFFTHFHAEATLPGSGLTLSTALAFDLGELVSGALSAFGHEAKRKGVVLAAEVVGVEIEGDAAQLGEAVLHLVKRGIDQGAQGGQLHVSVARRGSEAVLELEHDGQGAGCPVATAREGRAERLLSLAEQIVELHRGNLKTRKEGRSRRVEVRLPLAGSTDR